MGNPKLVLLEVFYLLLAAGLTVVTILFSSDEPLYLICIWPASNFFIVFMCYVLDQEFGSFVLLKNKETGCFSPCSWIYWLPFYLFIWITWSIKHIIACESPYDLCYTTTNDKRIWIGRYPVFGLPKECDIIVDCTVEFPGRRIKGGEYLNVPSLDMVLAPPEEFRAAAKQVIAWFDQGRKSAFIHCANGHGRSALFAALVMIFMDEAKTLDECKSILKSKRKVINWQPNQAEIVMEAMALEPVVIELAAVKDSEEKPLRNPSGEVGEKEGMPSKYLPPQDAAQLEDSGQEEPLQKNLSKCKQAQTEI